MNHWLENLVNSLGRKIMNKKVQIIAVLLCLSGSEIVASASAMGKLRAAAQAASAAAKTIIKDKGHAFGLWSGKQIGEHPLRSLLLLLEGGAFLTFSHWISNQNIRNKHEQDIRDIYEKMQKSRDAVNNFHNKNLKNVERRLSKEIERREQALIELLDLKDGQTFEQAVEIFRLKRKLEEEKNQWSWNRAWNNAKEMWGTTSSESAAQVPQPVNAEGLGNDIAKKILAKNPSVPGARSAAAQMPQQVKAMSSPTSKAVAKNPVPVDTRALTTRGLEQIVGKNSSVFGK